MGFLRRTLTGTLTTTRSNSTSTSTSSNPSPQASGTTTPTASTAPPALTLTKTHSRLGLSKTLTWGRRREEDKYKRRVESWEKEDANEWNAPTGRRPGRKMASKQHQEVLRAFEWKTGRNSIEGRRSGSVFSGISPGCSRMNSIDDGRVGLHSTARQRSLAQGVGASLSREVSRSEDNLAA